MALQTIGLEADAYLRRRGKGWQKTASRWPKVDLPEFTRFPERKQHALFAAHVRTQVARSGFRTELIRRRLHAYIHAMALHLRNTARRATAATENDSEDILTLMHLAEPAFLLTHDDKLIRAVDSSGTYQAPWVLRLSQFLKGNLPTVRPWGPKALSVAAQFRRQACEGPCGICRQR